MTGPQTDLIRQFLNLAPTQADIDKLVEWRKSRKTTVTSVLADWHAAKLAELHGKETATLRKTHQWLEKFAKSFGDRSAAEIPEKEIRLYIENASKSPKSRIDFRTRIVSLWRFARIHEHFDSQEAAKLPSYKAEKKGHISVWSPDEMKMLLAAVDKEFLPWLCFAGFSGLRSEEISPSASTGKPPLRWEWVKRDQRVIDIPASLSKVKKRRLVPITDTLAAWLDFIDPPKEGVVCPRLPSKYATKTLGESVGGWRKNDLRHSYGTYRAAVLKNLPQLALEMGNSVEKIEDHYREAVSEEMANSYWNLRP